MADLAIFDAQVDELLRTKYTARLDASFADVKNEIENTDFKARMLEALDHGYAAFILSKEEITTYTRAQQDELMQIIRSKMEPLHLHNYKFTVMPAALRAFAGQRGIIVIDEYRPQQ